jgi:hypothetical protein
MKAEIKRIRSLTIDHLEAFHPEPADDFGFDLELDVGAVGEEGEDVFELTVCTPRWLEKHHRKTDIVSGRHHLIVFEYNFERLQVALAEACAACEGETWKEVAEKFARFARWEFEDYRPYS